MLALILLGLRHSLSHSQFSSSLIAVPAQYSFFFKFLNTIFVSIKPYVPREPQKDPSI